MRRAVKHNDLQTHREGRLIWRELEISLRVEVPMNARRSYRDKLVIHYDRFT